MREKNKKGFFGPGLPVAGRYIYPMTRRRLVAYGALAVAALLLYTGLDLTLNQGVFLSDGPLSSAHAVFESDCSTCHTANIGPVSEKCSACHDPSASDIGAYSFAAHYLYRGNDFRRVSGHDRETECAACHTEHEGREGVPTHVDDNRCLSCHEQHRFQNRHPRFEAVGKPEKTALKFPHVKHIRELMERFELATPEATCVRCHVPQEDGRGFSPISFDTQCDACHLTTSTATPRLAVKQGDAPGVHTLTQIQEAHAPGSLWSYYANPGEYRLTGKRLISKSPVHHKDPWILTNLAMLHREVYGDRGLTDLLQAAPDEQSDEARELYAEAITTLRGYALELRARPEQELQDELARIDAALTRAETELKDPFAAPDVSVFLPPPTPREGISAEQIAEIQVLAEDLTEPCRGCHQLTQLSLGRIDQDQRSLHRANFNHAAHVIQRGCLDCHNRFPADAFTGPANPDRELPAEVLNLPDIDTCRGCHNDQAASDKCITCHSFHPDRERRAFLSAHPR